MMRRTIAALAASKQSGPYRAKLKPPAMPVVMTEKIAHVRCNIRRKVLHGENQVF